MLDNFFSAFLRAMLVAVGVIVFACLPIILGILVQ